MFGRRATFQPRMRRLLMLALLAFLAAAPARAATADGETVVAVIDTGINMGHRAFDPGQVVAWWDFSEGKTPAAGDTWDEAHPPRDRIGHGTATAAMVAGRKTDPDQSPSL